VGRPRHADTGVRHNSTVPGGRCYRRLQEEERDRASD
jgi:hypothetical protein